MEPKRHEIWNEFSLTFMDYTQEQTVIKHNQKYNLYHTVNVALFISHFPWCKICMGRLERQCNREHRSLTYMAQTAKTTFKVFP